MPDHAFILPPEWAPQAAVWVGWPRLPEEWGAAFEPARREIAAVIRALSKHVPVRIAAGDPAAGRLAGEMTGGAGEVCELPTGDIWLRDTGPVFGFDAAGARIAKCFSFNGWGRKYLMPGDTGTAQAIAQAEGATICQHAFILEGGAIDHDGNATILTTRECLLNPNRNPGWSQADAEAALQAALGARRIVWLSEGLLNDHTDGHVDNAARFIGPGRVVCQRASGADDPHAGRLVAIKAQLREAGLEVVTIPSPGRILDREGEPAPASHMNFIFANGTILLPVYDTVYGAQAAEALADAMPGWRVEPHPSGAILAGGGSFHCMTREVPKLPGRSGK